MPSALRQRNAPTQTLATEWKQYEIDLTGVDLTKAVTLFTWDPSDLLNPNGATLTCRMCSSNAPADRPILDVAVGSGFFFVLAEKPNREIVLGAFVIAPRGVRRPTPAEFAAFAEPGFAKAAINFRVEDEGGGWCRVVTETRTDATDSASERSSAAYWRTIEPGSALIRRMWLRGIQRRAETR